MGEAGKSDQRIKLRRLRLNEHLAGKARAEFGDTDTAGLADDRVIVGKPQYGGGREYLHCVGI